MCFKCRLITLSINLDDLEPELRRVAKLLYSGKLKPGQIDAAMVKAIADQLMKGVLKGYGNISLKDLTPSQRTFLTHVQNNIYVFSGFKNYHQLKETSLLLLDDAGSYKSFNKFFEAVKQINETYNSVYLEAEYNNALASGQAAQAWQDFIANGVDMLMFQTAGDDRVREDHAVMNGIIVPIGDPLLDTYFTPLDWGCRCEWVSAPGEAPTGYSKAELPQIPPMFQNNVAKSGIVFPDTHPYFDVSASVAKQVLDQVDDIPKPELATIGETEGFVPSGLTTYETKAGVTIDKSIFKMLKKETPIVDKKRGAFYSPTTNEVNIKLDDRTTKSKWHSERVIYHEYGHAVDWQKGLRGAQPVKDLMEKYRKIYRGKLNEVENKLSKISSEAFFSKDYDIKEKANATADTLMSLNPQYGWGHTKSYFKNPNFKEAEFIAHAFENKFIGNNVFREVMPDLYEETVKLVEEYAKLK